MDTPEVDEIKEIDHQIKVLRARRQKLSDRLLAGEAPLKSARHVARIERRLVVRERTDNTDVSELLLHLKANYV